MNGTSWKLRLARSLVAAALAVAWAAPARGQAQAPGGTAPSASPTPTAAPASPGPGDCSVVGAAEIGEILGYEVNPADEQSQSGGLCFFASRAIAHDGSASYAIVDADRLQQRRSYYAVLARRCANVQPGAPRYVVCKQFQDLAQVKDVDAYFALRTGFPNAEPVKGLGDAAVASGDALYVRRGDVVFEVVVRRGDALDVDRATTLAKLLLARIPASPEPSPSPRRPKDS